MIDSHCHFDFDDFAPDRAQVWERCLAAGIERLVIPGVSVAQWRSLFALVGTESRWYGAVGVHPWWVADLALAPEKLQQALVERVNKERAGSGRCVAIGECGLDGHIATAMEVQIAALRPQLAAACELDLPLILHSVKAHSELLRQLKEFRPSRGGVIHAFSGSREIAREYWKLGFYLGIGGTVTYARAAKTRSTVSEVPLESLLLESDAPDMPHAGHQGERNSPEYLPAIAETVAALRGIPVAEVCLQTRRNTERLFDL
ncbi:TatD family hydrolase [uncultured Microbulbifer sp.]|mgnify:FL=1|uniref:TatD family hydrolase n=1 Tax=uncultured Microbulbifer sp. TaxID=348147 RepID=UPI0025E31E1B|nr:TatD family hydrolase [uncultured Microbulbifer sp.]